MIEMTSAGIKYSQFVNWRLAFPALIAVHPNREMCRWYPQRDNNLQWSDYYLLLEVGRLNILLS